MYFKHIFLAHAFHFDMADSHTDPVQSQPLKQAEILSQDLTRLKALIKRSFIINLRLF